MVMQCGFTSSQCSFVPIVLAMSIPARKSRQGSMPTCNGEDTAAEQGEESRYVNSTNQDTIVTNIDFFRINCTLFVLVFLPCFPFVLSVSHSRKSFCICLSSGVGVLFCVLLSVSLSRTWLCVCLSSDVNACMSGFCFTCICEMCKLSSGVTFPSFLLGPCRCTRSVDLSGVRCAKVNASLFVHMSSYLFRFPVFVVRMCS